MDDNGVVRATTPPGTMNAEVVVVVVGERLRRVVAMAAAVSFMVRMCVGTAGVLSCRVGQEVL